MNSSTSRKQSWQLWDHPTHAAEKVAMRQELQRITLQQPNGLAYTSQAAPEEDAVQAYLGTVAAAGSRDSRSTQGIIRPATEHHHGAIMMIATNCVACRRSTSAPDSQRQARGFVIFAA
jgi:hypothetical protein